MTAIILGKLQKANFIVADAMTQMTVNLSSYQECCLRDKITDIGYNNQYLVLLGEGLLANGAYLLLHWALIKGITIDLFNLKHFEELLKCAEKYRIYSVDIEKFSIIPQPQSNIYIVDRDKIKEYVVKYNGINFIIES